VSSLQAAAFAAQEAEDAILLSADLVRLIAPTFSSAKS